MFSYKFLNVTTGQNEGNWKFFNKNSQKLKKNSRKTLKY